MRTIIIIVLWLGLVLLCAKWVSPWQPMHQYENLLSTSAEQILKDHPAITIDVFAAPNSAAANLVGNFLAPLLSILPTAEVNFLEASEQLKSASQWGIQKQGEMVIESRGHNFQLNTLSYEGFFNGLKRISSPNDRWTIFLTGLDGKSFQPNQADGYSDWLDTLLAANYQAMVLEWQAGIKLPAMTQLIILAAPATPLTQEQLDWLETQLQRGTSLWWLTDPQLTINQPQLALLFDVMQTEAYHQGQLIIKNLPSHEINQAFDRPLDLNGVMPFVTANQPVLKNAAGEVLAASQELEGDHDNSRLLVIGDSDFLNNNHLLSGGNLEMSFRMLDWLLHNDDRIDVPSIGLGQTQLHYSKLQILTFASIMLLVIPLILLIFGGVFWYRLRTHTTH